MTMLDFEKMRKLTQERTKDISSLTKEELTVLQGFSAYASDQAVTFGLSHKANIGDIAVNAFKAGFAFGLGVKIDDGKLVER